MTNFLPTDEFLGSERVFAQVFVQFEDSDCETRDFSNNDENFTTEWQCESCGFLILTGTVCFNCLVPTNELMIPSSDKRKRRLTICWSDAEENKVRNIFFILHRPNL